MKKYSTLLLVLGILFLSKQNSLMAQTIVVPDTVAGWEKTWVFNLNGSQSSFNNWAEGGVNTIGAAAATVFTTYYRKDRFAYGFRVNLRFGQSKIQDVGVRKIDDLISVRNRITYDLADHSKYAYYAAVQFRTQFTDGFDYGAAVSGGDSLISSWMAPAYITEGAGIEANFSEHFSAEAGLALKQTIISDEALSPKYGLSAGDKFQSEGGLTTGFTYQNSIMENVEFVTSLETFTSFIHPITSTDIFWASEVRGKINSTLSAILQFDLRYDDDFSKEVQLKQVLAAGLSVTLY